MTPDEVQTLPLTSLDVLGPYRGPCAMCGGPDARHRLADAVVGSVMAGDARVAVAHDYAVSLAAVDALLETRERNARRRKARWS